MDRKEEWFELKEKYDNLEIPKQGVENMKKRIEQAKIEEAKRNHSRKCKVSLYRRIGISAAAVLAAFTLFFNLNPSAAMAMEQIPIVRDIIKVITFGRYEFEDDRHHADVEIPQIEVENASAAADSANNINQEVTDYITPILDDFKNSLDEDTAKSLDIDYEVVTDTDTWFTLRLDILEIQASGYQYSKYYHIDKNTGRQMTLSDLFKEDADYISVISENIKTQMKEQMAADEGIVYFLDGEDMPGEVFDKIQPDQNFYFNQDGEIVIEFDEYEVAPGYMGIVSFIIPRDVTEALLK